MGLMIIVVLGILFFLSIANTLKNIQPIKTSFFD